MPTWKSFFSAGLAGLGQSDYRKDMMKQKRGLAYEIINHLKLSGLARLFVAMTALTLTTAALAAPMPGTSSSALVAPQLGLYRSPLGFEVGAGKSGWAHAEPPKNNKFVATLYANPKNNASLSVRVDELKKEMPLDRYVQRWVKEYPKYGFDVLGSQTFSQNKQRGYVVDLINRDTGKELRQVVFMKKQKAVIMTCRDSVKTFKDSLKDCNQIIRTFSWNE